MSQHDYNIANAAGAAVRADINNALESIVTLNAGGSAPATTYAYMLWADTDNGLLKIRNAANNAWITIGLLAGFKLDDWFAPDDNTDLNVSISAHGLCPKAPNDATKFLRGDGPTWATPPTMTPATNFQSYSKTIFGDGSDGNVTITENTTLPDSGIGVKVKQYNNLTIDVGCYLEPHANDKIFVCLVKGTLTLNGTLRANERGGLGGSGRSTEGSGYPGGVGAFGAGAGGGGGAGTGALGGNGGGGNWGSFPFIYGVGSGATGTELHGSAGTRQMLSPLTPLLFEIFRYLYGGGGGGGGRGSGTGTSGNGGRGGGVLWIEANAIVWGAAGKVTSNGGNGTVVTAYYAGGGGGAGGFIQLAYKNKTGTSTFEALGGGGGDSPTGYDGGSADGGLTGEFQIE